MPNKLEEPKFDDYNVIKVEIKNKHCLVIEGTGELVAVFQSDQDLESHFWPIRLNRWNDYGIAHKNYRRFVRENWQLYPPPIDKRNKITDAVFNGFLEKEGEFFNSFDNWFGVSLYHPIARLIRGNKEIYLSLNGAGIPEPDFFRTKEDFESYWNVAKAGKLKYIGLYIDDKAVYQNWYGEFPDDKFWNEFIAHPPSY
jgi:hypothetical protein